MPVRRFKLGQVVRYYPKGRRLSESCLVIEMLPMKDGVFCYRIRAVDDQHERVVKETELVNPFRSPR